MSAADLEETAEFCRLDHERLIAERARPEDRKTAVRRRLYFERLAVQARKAARS